MFGSEPPPYGLGKLVSVASTYEDDPVTSLHARIIAPITSVETVHERRARPSPLARLAAGHIVGYLASRSLSQISKA
jgi:hypothetical protein